MIFKFTNADMSELNENLRIKQILQRTKEIFIDPDFPPIPSNLGYSDRFLNKFKNVEWLPARGFCKDRKNLKVFSQYLSPASVKQGMLGDCYFLSVLSALTTKPHLIKRLFSSSEVNEQGCYSVWLCLSGMWRNILIDDCFPCIRGEPVFAKLVGNELWPMLLEKAYAKAYHCYEAIESGHTIDAIHMITGAPSEYVQLEKGNGWMKIKYAFSKNYLVTASSMEDGRAYADFETNALGIVPSHCYAVTDLFEVDSPGEKIRRIKLRNPWGRDYCKIRCNWSQKHVQLLGNPKRMEENSGELWMDFENFQNFFTALTINKINDDYYNAFKTIKAKDSKRMGDYCRLIVLEQSHIYLTLNQLDERNFKSSPTHYNYSPAKMFLVKFNGKFWEMIIGEFDEKRFISVETTLEPGEYYILSRMSWVKQEHNYTISAYSENPIVLEDCEPLKDFDIECQKNLEHNFRLRMSKFSSEFKTEAITTEGETILLQTSGEIFNYKGLVFDNISSNFIIEFEVSPHEFTNLKWIGGIGHQPGDLKYVLMPQTSRGLFFSEVTPHKGYACRFEYNYKYKRFI